MKFDLRRPCDGCPFRTDVKPYLHPERAHEIVTALVDEQKTFSCHKTNDFDDEGDTLETAESQHCAGAMIMLEKMERPNQMMRIAERLGQYDYLALDMSAPVYDSGREMTRAYSRERRRR